jgi:hypothetical protein
MQSTLNQTMAKKLAHYVHRVFSSLEKKPGYKLGMHVSFEKMAHWINLATRVAFKVCDIKSAVENYGAHHNISASLVGIARPTIQQHNCTINHIPVPIVTKTISPSDEGYWACEELGLKHCYQCEMDYFSNSSCAQTHNQHNRDFSSYIFGDLINC